MRARGRLHEPHERVGKQFIARHVKISYHKSRRSQIVTIVSNKFSYRLINGIHVLTLYQLGIFAHEFRYVGRRAIAFYLRMQQVGNVELAFQFIAIFGHDSCQRSTSAQGQRHERRTL